MELLPVSTNDILKLTGVSSNDDAMKPCAKIYRDWFRRFRFHFFSLPKNVKIRQVVVERFGIVDQSPHHNIDLRLLREEGCLSLNSSLSVSILSPAWCFCRRLRKPFPISALASYQGTWDALRGFWRCTGDFQELLWCYRGWRELMNDAAANLNFCQPSLPFMGS